MVRLRFSKNDDQESVFCRRTEQDESLLVVWMLWVLDDAGKWITEGGAGFSEMNVMLTKIPRSLIGVPVEPHSATPWSWAVSIVTPEGPGSWAATKTAEGGGRGPVLSLMRPQGEYAEARQEPQRSPMVQTRTSARPLLLRLFQNRNDVRTMRRAQRGVTFMAHTSLRILAG